MNPFFTFISLFPRQPAFFWAGHLIITIIIGVYWHPPGIIGLWQQIYSTPASKP